MHILLVNDDGIAAKGIRTLCREAAAQGHRVSVCAPDRERSAASHSITLGRSLHVAEASAEGAQRAWAADGTPADCVALGLFLTRDDPVDVVISGVNRGMNLGAACLYSGTVAAAMEASIHGAQAMAASLCTLRRDDEDDYVPAARLALKLAGWLCGHPMPSGSILSLNVPPLPAGEIRGLRSAPLAPVFFGACPFREVRDEAGAGYRYCGGRGDHPIGEESDLALMEAGWAVVTPLKWDWQTEYDGAAPDKIEL